MFLGRRSAQAEYFDLPDRAASETAQAFRDLDRINRFFQFERPFKEVLPRWLGRETCRHLKILDVGAGTGLLSTTLAAWAAQRGWNWQFTNLDSNPQAIQPGNPAHAVVGSALKLPFPDASFDLVIASQMTHHLSDAEARIHLQEAWRVTRDAVMISDMHRNQGLRVMLWIATRLLRVSKSVRADAIISVERSFRRPELARLAAEAGLRDARVWLYYGSRIVLQARKNGGASPQATRH